MFANSCEKVGDRIQTGSKPDSFNKVPSLIVTHQIDLTKLFLAQCLEFLGKYEPEGELLERDKFVAIVVRPPSKHSSSFVADFLGVFAPTLTDVYRKPIVST